MFLNKTQRLEKAQKKLVRSVSEMRRDEMTLLELSGKMNSVVPVKELVRPHSRGCEADPYSCFDKVSLFEDPRCSSAPYPSSSNTHCRQGHPQTCNTYERIPSLPPAFKLRAEKLRKPLPANLKSYLKRYEHPKEAQLDSVPTFEKHYFAFHSGRVY